MPPKCYICKVYDPKRMKIFRIPDRHDEYSERSGLWLKLLDETQVNVERIRICSDHFLQKKPAKSSDYLNLDWIPNKNLGQFSKNWKKIEYHFRKRNIAPPPVHNPRQLEINQNHPVIESRNKQYVSPRENGLMTSDKGSSTVSLKNISDKKTPMSPDTLVPSSKNTMVHTDKSNDSMITTNLYDTGNETSFAASLHESNSFVGPINSILPLKKKRIHIIEEIFFMPKEIQTELSIKDIDLLFKYYQEAVEERNQLLKKISYLVIDIDYFKGNDKKSRFYTGLTTWSLLERFVELVKDYLPSHFNCKLSRFQMVVLTLMKLRLNLTYKDLGYRFQVDETTAARYFYRCLYILHKIFSNSKLVHWPDERENLLRNTPSYFRSAFKEHVTIIVDCFEIFCESPAVLRALAQGFSIYKHHETLKFLIGISTTGVIIFISIAFGGRASDKEIVMKSGFLDKLQEGDLVLADKGFLVANEVEAKKASLRIPCFVRNNNQLHPTEVEVSRNYSRLRIHVERLINVLRRKFNICADIARISAIAKENDLFESNMYDKILLVCSALVNICPSVVNTDFEI